MARISTRSLLDGGQRTTPPISTTSPTAVTPAFTPNPQDVRDPVTGLTPAQTAAKKALDEAVAAGAKLGIETKPTVATAGNVPTVTVTKVPTTTASTTKTKKEVRRETLGSGLDRIIRVYYDDGTFEDFPSAETPGSNVNKKIKSTYIDPNTGDVIAVYEDGTTAILSKGTKQSDAAKAAAAQAAAEKASRQSAFDLLLQQFSQYGLGGLVEPLRALIESGTNPAEFTIRLRETDAYKKRFAANAQRINKGLRALSEAEYITLEDQYQDVMRRYGLPQSFYARGDMGRQEGFEKFIGGDVSPVELEDRIQTAQNRVTNAPSQVRDALSQFYGAELGNGDILAYVLDPEKALPDIKRKVTAAEIGAGALQAGLRTGVGRAEELGRFGVTGEVARKGFQTIAGGLERGRQLSKIYQQPEYTQTTAEEEEFSLPGAVQSGRQRKKIIGLERATFGGTSGITGGALDRERAGQY